MKNEVPVYRKPEITTYGTVRELTLGTGGAADADILPCATGTFRSTSPSGVTCKANA